ncbi:MAG: hypothetical protein Q9180_009635, partial [Flavoplaca navasiana]
PIDGYLNSYKSKIEATADSTGGAFKDFTGEDVVGTYFAQFCKDKYKATQDYVKDQLDKLDDGDEESSDCLPLGSMQTFPTLFLSVIDGC